jgi:hypothetical protein
MECYGVLQALPPVSLDHGVCRSAVAEPSCTASVEIRGHTLQTGWFESMAPTVLGIGSKQVSQMLVAGLCMVGGECQTCRLLNQRWQHQRQVVRAHQLASVRLWRFS